MWTFVPPLTFFPKWRDQSSLFKFLTMLIVNITSLVIHLHFGINDSIRNSHKFLIVGGGETLVDRENQSLVLMLQSTFTKHFHDNGRVRGASKQSSKLSPRGSFIILRKHSNGLQGCTSKIHANQKARELRQSICVCKLKLLVLSSWVS